MDICAVGKKNYGCDAEECPTTMKQAIEHLDETYKKSINIRIS